MTSDAERQRLLRIARDAIERRVRGERGFADCGPSGDLLPPCGVFVTIEARGTLRGCIGRIEGDEPLEHLIRACAISACSADPRFAPIAPAELPAIDIELSLISPLEPISGPADVEVGRHGLLVEHGSHRGLLLPQVATEHQWDAATFLAQTCHKAGLPSDAWRANATLWRFEAEVFGEHVTAGD
jgi:AmmeMemoRadiSam system protein A